MNYRKCLSLAACLTVAIGCQAPQQTPPASSSISCRLPEITPLPETKASQEKGGLEITITPATYKAVRKDRRVLVEAEPNLAEGLVAPPKDERPNYSFIQESIIPELKSEPDRLQFAVRINNKLARVFRGQGSVIQVNVGGKLMPINRKDYAEFVDSIVPPRNETELNIYGPALDAIPESGTIGIFVYDAVTATDAAGAVIEKQNYEWYFSYTTRLAHDQGTMQVKRKWVKNSALRRATQ